MEISTEQFNPRVIEQTTSSVTIAWDKISSNDAEVYKVERHHKTGEWTTVYWGTESPAKVENLDENFGYVFRIVAMKFTEEKGYQPISVSDDFVGSTLLFPPSTMILFRSIRKGEQYLTKRLIQKRPNLMELPSSNGNTPLANAIDLGEKDVFDVLMTAGVSVHIGNTINKRTPLHFAFFHGQLAMSRMLLNKKANLNAQDCIEMSPSHYAVDAENFEILKFSLENNCNAEIKDNNGWTLLHRAIIMNVDFTIIKLLVTHGCKVDAIDNRGLNCIQLAEIRNREIAKFLENHLEMQKVATVEKKLTEDVEVVKKRSSKMQIDKNIKRKFIKDKSNDKDQIEDLEGEEENDEGEDKEENNITQDSILMINEE